MENVAVSTKRWSRAGRARIAVATCAALLAVPATASAAATTATTTPVDRSLITDTYALISGIVNPGGTATAYWFEWGKTAGYGQTTPVTQAGNGAADVPVDVSLDTLAPATTYHFRLVARAAADSNAAPILGADQSFKTAPALAVSILGRRALVKGGKALVRLQAVGPADEVAAGVLQLTAKIAGKLRPVGSVAYTLAAGARDTARVRLNAAGKQALLAAPGRRLPVRATAKTTGIKRPVARGLTLAG